MRKMKKTRIISLVCAIAMLFSVVSVSAANLAAGTFFNGTEEDVTVSWASTAGNVTITSVNGLYGKAESNKVFKLEGFTNTGVAGNDCISLGGNQNYGYDVHTQVCINDQTTKITYKPRFYLNGTL